jgi:thiamine pyrophosphokinase
VFTGGGPVDPSLRDKVGAVDYVIAADSGLYAARQLDLTVDLLVGDHTDIVLALDRARALRPRRLLVVSGGGGRLDHAFANLLVLAAPAYADMQIDALIGGARVAVIRTRRDLSGPEGGLISLFAVDGRARGVTTSGLRYELRDDVLEPLSSRGVSNEFIGGPATVRLTSGVLLSIQPAEETT